ncbi:MAG: hypothetical protein K2H22_01040, partial [Muribaculaceae bacterium]|nr:hypothetical protein [Muribaculaceae bacterium]
MNGDYREKWSRCLDIIRDNVGEERFNIWFSPSKAVRYEGNKLILGLPTQYFMEEYEDRYFDLIKGVLRKEFGPDVQLGYEIDVINGDKQSAVNFTSPNRSNAVDTRFMQSMQRPAADFLKSSGGQTVEV